MKIKLLISVISMCLMISPLWARDLSQLYSKQELSQALHRYGPNINSLFSKDFLSRLTFQERSRAQHIRLVTPYVGHNKSPWDFYSLIDQQSIVIPILSLKFLDDISIAYAYMDRHECNMEMFYNYLTKLIYDDQYTPAPPQRALGIPGNALKDEFVDDVSQKLLKSSIYFLIGHEYAHIIYRHRGYDEISGTKAQTQEIDSDNFSLNILRRIGVAPTGLAFFFSVASRLEATPSSFESHQAFEKYIKQTSTHPLTGERLENIAQYMNQYAQDFVRLQSNPPRAIVSITTTATEIKTIGSILNDGMFRQFQLQKGLRTTARQLGSACS